MPFTRSLWRPGTWVRAYVTPFDISVITWALGTLAFIRAFDYATPPPWDGDPRVTPGLAVVEAAAPMSLWIAVLAVGGGLLLSSAWLEIHRGIWAGHLILGAVYAGLAVGFTAEYITQPWADGVRSAGPMWLVLALHLLLAFRTDWRPHGGASAH